MLKIILLSLSLTFAGSLDSLLSTRDTLKVLGIWCHPDDETAFMAMVAAKAQQRNQIGAKIEVMALNLKDGKDEQCLMGILNGDTLYSRGCPCAWGITYCPELMGPFRLSRMAEAKGILSMKNRFYPLDSLLMAVQGDTVIAVDSLFKWINKYKPDILMTHNLAGDYVSGLSQANKRDHALVSALVLSAYNRLSVKPLFYMSVFNYRKDDGNLLQTQAIGAPIATDSIEGVELWNQLKLAGNRYDGSGFYMDINNVGANYQKNWFYRIDP